MGCCQKNFAYVKQFWRDIQVLNHPRCTSWLNFLFTGIHIDFWRPILAILKAIHNCVNATKSDPNRLEKPHADPPVVAVLLKELAMPCGDILGPKKPDDVSHIQWWICMLLKANTSHNIRVLLPTPQIQDDTRVVNSGSALMAMTWPTAVEGHTLHQISDPSHPSLEMMISGW